MTKKEYFRQYYLNVRKYRKKGEVKPKKIIPKIDILEQDYLQHIQNQNLEIKQKIETMTVHLANIIKDYWLIETTNNTFYKKDFFKFKSIEAVPDNYFHIVFENLEDQPDYDIHIDMFQALQYIESSSFQYVVNQSDNTAFETFHKDEIEITDKEDEN